MSYTFYSAIAKESMAYRAGYISGFSQSEPDIRAYKAGDVLFDKYYEGRRDGIADMMSAGTKTGVK